MKLTYHCAHCEQPAEATLSADTETIDCPHCRQALRVPPGAIEQGRVRRCLVCPSTDLFVRKDFPQRLGVAIVAVGILASSIAWAYMAVNLTFGILFATALVDVVLYMVVGEVLTCYRCHAEYRSVNDIEQHKAFDLETHERYRQQAARTTEKQQRVSS